jgi:hypothetical protein
MFRPESYGFHVELNNMFALRCLQRHDQSPQCNGPECAVECGYRNVRADWR